MKLPDFFSILISPDPLVRKIVIPEETSSFTTPLSTINIYFNNYKKKIISY